MESSQKGKSRIYWRTRGGVRRAYADFRDLGGKRMALIAPGDSQATSDLVIAEKLTADQLASLQSDKRDAVIRGINRRVTLKEFASEHLVKKAEANKFSDSYLEGCELALTRAEKHFGASRDLNSISVQNVQDWVTTLASQSNGRGGTLKGGTLRHHINSLSNMYRRAAAEGCVPLGYNPALALMDKPSSKAEEAAFLEVFQAALLLESARTFVYDRPHLANGNIHPLIATYLLTGARESEVLGLEVQDVDFARKLIWFRPNQWRTLKTKKSQRSVPLWPQLEKILRDYLKSRKLKSVLLFPSAKLLGLGMITDFRKALDLVAMRVGWNRGEVRSKAFRHTYCTMRLQTLDHGRPVSEFTVGIELGHGGFSLVRKVYGHLGKVRQRLEVVEYRVELYRKRDDVAPYLRALRKKKK